jgi:hypothetical protein
MKSNDKDSQLRKVLWRGGCATPVFDAAQKVQPRRRGGVTVFTSR